MSIIPSATQIPHPVSAGRHIAFGGRMPTDAMRRIAPDPVDEPNFWFDVLEPLPLNLPTVTGGVEVIRNSGCDTCEVDVIGLNTRSRGMTPDEAFQLSRLIYAAGKQAQLLNEGLSPELAVLVGRAITQTAGTR